MTREWLREMADVLAAIGLMNESYALRMACEPHLLAAAQRSSQAARILASMLDRTVPEPGQHIASLPCPWCGVDLEIAHGYDPGEIMAISDGTPAEAIAKETDR